MPRRPGRLLVAVAAFLAVPAVAAPGQTTARRCGWIVNPTPGNWWLVDRDGEWVFGTQGGRQVPGLDSLPDLSTREWIATNGGYGYGCGCLTVTSGPRSHRVIRIANYRLRPLKACRSDRKLPRPD